MQRRRTCRNVGVEHRPVLQGTSVPAAHGVAFLWKVGFVAFLQHGLCVLRGTLRKEMQTCFILSLCVKPKWELVNQSRTSSTASVFTSLGLSSILTSFTCSVTSSTGSVPLNLCKTTRSSVNVGMRLSSLQQTTNTHFALEQLTVGDDQLFFLCSFCNVFYVSHQLVLTEELKEKRG